MFRDLNGCVARGALAGVTALQKRHAREEDHTITLRHVFLLRKLVHPCLAEFYGAYCPGCNSIWDKKGQFQLADNTSAMFVTEMTTHTLHSAL